MRNPTIKTQQVCRTCLGNRRRNQLLCPSCWALVPKPLQDAVNILYEPTAAHQTFGYLHAAAEAVKAVTDALATQRAAATAMPEGGLL
jgi:hypothetical protein